MESRKKGFLVGGLALGGLLLTGYLAVFVVPTALVTFSNAAPMAKVSLSESYIVGMKMLAKADGVDFCKVDVFVLDGTGKGVQGKTVTLKGLSGVKPSNLTTDANGSAIFSLISNTEGQFPVTAMVDGMALTRQTKVTFRNSD